MLDPASFGLQLSEARQHGSNGDYGSSLVYYDGVIDQLQR
jgi:hypothetical protein